MAMFNPILWPQNMKQQREIDHQGLLWKEREHDPGKKSPRGILMAIHFPGYLGHRWFFVRNFNI
jgi:hypothetical protein